MGDSREGAGGRLAGGDRQISEVRARHPQRWLVLRLAVVIATESRPEARSSQTWSLRLMI
jgi:hypothetical protein